MAWSSVFGLFITCSNNKEIRLNQNPEKHFAFLALHRSACFIRKRITKSLFHFDMWISSFSGELDKFDAGRVLEEKQMAEFMKINGYNSEANQAGPKGQAKMNVIDNASAAEAISDSNSTKSNAINIKNAVRSDTNLGLLSSYFCDKATFSSQLNLGMVLKKIIVYIRRLGVSEALSAQLQSLFLG